MEGLCSCNLLNDSDQLTAFQGSPTSTSLIPSTVGDLMFWLVHGDFNALQQDAGLEWMSRLSTSNCRYKSLCVVAFVDLVL